MYKWSSHSLANCNNVHFVTLFIPLRRLLGTCSSQFTVHYGALEIQIFKLIPDQTLFRVEQVAKTLIMNSLPNNSFALPDGKSSHTQGIFSFLHESNYNIEVFYFSPNVFRRLCLWPKNYFNRRFKLWNLYYKILKSKENKAKMWRWRYRSDQLWLFLSIVVFCVLTPCGLVVVTNVLEECIALMIRVEDHTDSQSKI